MRLISFAVAISFALVSAAGLAQQSPPATGDAIGRPPPLPGPPPPPEPPAMPAPGNSRPAASQSDSKGYTGAYAPNVAPPALSSTTPLPQSSTGPGLNIMGPDGETRTVKAVPCTVSSRETDGFTTCVGIPERGMGRRRRY
jgi:hypothetical protein